jgi:hypothetical protein
MIWSVPISKLQANPFQCINMALDFSAKRAQGFL